MSPIEGWWVAMDDEGERATALLAGKTVKHIRRFREQEVVIEFEDGSRFFADSPAPLELSITISD
ncbi:hypothetical protein KRZ98_23065 [Sphingobium sp. AS12]|uniref:hypothetical protein n=1 Tax=Sphingobium sp. AS12 TaxID=2849495 RepID=UPI001C31250F|nr:hypothetical protein [Sphingobium sp. AS12]MBV2151085.1 hypothetical protein [Sphingobium sp. AS12]